MTRTLASTTFLPVLAVALVGCGGSSSAARSQATVLRPAIVAVERPAAGALRRDFLSASRTGSAPACQAPDGAESHLCDDAAHNRPTAARAPRIVARLDLVAPGRSRAAALFVTFESADHVQCFDLASVRRGRSGPLACVENPACLEGSCFVRRSGGRLPVGHAVLGGLVEAGATSLRVRFRDGSTAELDVAGPRVPAFPGRRAFLADVGTRTPRSVDVVRNGEIAEALAVP